MNDHLQDFNQQEQSIDYKALLFKIYRYWYFFAITIFIALVLAFVFNKYTKPVYEVKATLLIKDKSENKLDPSALLGIGLMNNQQNLQNEIGILTSQALTYRTVTKLGFEVSYFRESNFVTSELYKDCPFVVSFDSSFPQPVGLRFYLTILSRDHYSITADGEEVGFYIFREKLAPEGKKAKIQVNETYKFGQVGQSGGYRFTVLLNENFSPEEDLNQTFYFIMNDYDALASQYKAFTVEPINREASIVEIKLKGGNVHKLADFLNTLCREYMAKGLEKKNLVATRTINFIDGELQGISDSLDASERALMQFRTNKEIMNLDDEARSVFEKMMELQDEKATLMVRAKYLQNMKEYIEQNQKLDELIVPATMGIDNVILNDLTRKLTELYMKRTDMAQ